MTRRLLLVFGVAASLLYAATDWIGGMVYEGYSFTSQAISELMANGAPSERIVDPLFLTYAVLMMAFSATVFHEARDNRKLRIASALLFVYAAVGVTGPTLFEMQPRGTGALEESMAHIVVTGVIVLLLLLTIGFGAFSLGDRFRRYSFATLFLIIAFGAVSGVYGKRLADGLSTPGFGIVERITVYASLAWVAVLAIALLRRPVARLA